MITSQKTEVVTRADFARAYVHAIVMNNIVVFWDVELCVSEKHAAGIFAEGSDARFLPNGGHQTIRGLGQSRRQVLRDLRVSWHKILRPKSTPVSWCKVSDRWL